MTAAWGRLKNGEVSGDVVTRPKGILEKCAFGFALVCLATYMLHLQAILMDYQDAQIEFAKSQDSLSITEEDEPVVIDPSRSFSNLIRSRVIPYRKFKKREKYLVFTPLGGIQGFSFSLSCSLHLGRLFGRSVVVPQVSAHTEDISAYFGQGRDHTTRAENIFDLQYVGDKTGLNLFSLNVSFKELHDDVLRQLPSTEIEIINLPTAPSTFGSEEVDYREVLITGMKSKKRVIWLRGELYNKNWLRQRIQEKVRPTTFISSVVESISASLFKSKPFSVLHVSCDVSEDDFIKWIEVARSCGAAAESGFVYVISENECAFKLEKGLKPILGDEAKFQRDLVSNPGLSQLVDRFPPVAALKSDVIQYVEDLISARASYFVGSESSDRSKSIHRMRRQMRSTFPPSKRIKVSALLQRNGELSNFHQH